MASIALGAHYEKFVQDLLDKGRYDNASEVVQEGLRMLEDYESSREHWIKEKLPGRLAEHQSDPSTGISADDVHAQLRERMTAKG